MAEVFGAVAGALTIAELATKIISRCKHLIETTRNAPKDLRHVLIEISSLKATVDSLHFLSNSDEEFADSLQKRSEIEGAINNCRNTMVDLACELDGLSISQAFQSGSNKRQKLKGSLAWCLKESKTSKLLDAAMHHKSTMTLALLSDVAHDIKGLKGKVGKIESTLTDAKLADVCGWLEQSNPTSAHNEACKVREEGTCTWMLRLPQWQDWVTGANRFLWVHGIPGAGKTVMASYVNEQVQSLCPSRSNRFCHIYYYFSYRQTEKPTAAFLRWLLNQLCRHLKVVPQHIQQAFERSVEPKLSDLISDIRSLLDFVDKIYLVIDAVDECDDRDELLNTLTAFSTDSGFSKIHILATSRDYLDIRTTLDPLSVQVSMLNELVSEDIRTYIEQEMHANCRLNRWPPNIKSEILEALVEGAKGMFRWAACQLYVLQKKRSESDIRRL